MSADEAIPYAEVLARIAELADVLARHEDPTVTRQVTELLDWIDAFHRDGLGRLVEMIRAWRGEIFLDTAGEDELVGLLLAAYGLGEAGDGQAETAAAVATALEQVRPVVESHGGDIEVASVRDGVVQVRMTGTCDGCPSSAATLVYGVEAALRDHWVHFRRLEVLDPPTTADPEKSDLVCVTVTQPVTQPVTWSPVELRGHPGDRRH